MKAVLAAPAAGAIVTVLVALLLQAARDAAPASVVAGPYPGVAAGPTLGPNSVDAPSATPSPTSPPPPPTPAPAETPPPPPAVQAAEATPAPAPPTSVAPAAPAQPAAHERCPLLPIMISPSQELQAAATASIDMWERYLACDAFTLAAGGMAVTYAAEWPGVCLNADIAACTYNGIFLSPLAPLYEPASVIAHELGHVLNFRHEGGPSVMSPASWSGAETVFCEVDARCQ